MDPIEEQRILAQQEQVKQAQLQTQAQQGLGKPPEAPFEYKENPSMGLMNAHVGDQMEKRAQQKQQEALAARAEADKMTGGYAGYKSDAIGNEQPHPNEGWSPSSDAAHNMNIQIADRIKNGSLDTQTAMIAMQNPEVSPEIKQALNVIVQQAQMDGSGQQMAPEQETSGEMAGQAGLGSIPLPQ